MVAFYDFTYDAANRIRKITDIDGVRSYDYDETDQLLAADYNNSDGTDSTTEDESYQYDANGNRINSSLHGSGYVTGNENRLESDGESVYQYDNEGNLIRQTAIATGESREFEWDYRNRLIAVTDRDSSGNEVQVVSYSYDAMNRRLAKVVDTNLADASEGKATYFVYERDNVILDFVDVDGTTGSALPQLEQRYLELICKENLKKIGVALNGLLG